MGLTPILAGSPPIVIVRLSITMGISSGRVETSPSNTLRENPVVKSTTIKAELSPLAVSAT